MWIFADFGLLMPAVVPPEFITEGTENGLQVRARVKEHLEWFAENYMREGSYEPIYHTPEMDYNYRFHTTHEEFAKAMVIAMMEIDYEKFKPTAERYSWGKKYHGVLNSIWGTVTGLGAPGGSWANWGKAKVQSTFPARKGSGKVLYPAGGGIGSTFGARASAADAAELSREYGSFDEWDESGYNSYGLSAAELENLTDAELNDLIQSEGVEDYESDDDKERDKILASLSDIPLEQWQEMCQEWEWPLIKAEHARLTEAYVKELLADAREEDQGDTDTGPKVITEKKPFTNHKTRTTKAPVRQ